MSKRIFLFLIFCNAGILFLQAQTDKPPITTTEESISPKASSTEQNETPNNEEEVYTIVEQIPEFPGGQAAMYEYLNKNMNYPEQAKKDEIQGKVWVEFVVDKEGNVSKVQILRGIGGGCDEEAARVVKNMPKWKPGMQGGKPVMVKFRLPINFVI